MELVIKQLIPETLDDYLFFFDNITFSENPEWSACYCFSYHFVGKKEQWNRENNRASVIKIVNENKMTGYLAYHKEKPVGWCNVNNRMNYQRLLKYYNLIDNPADKVCSIVCFLIHPNYRRQRIAKKLMDRICKDYTELNYDYLEAYPAKGELSCEGHYKGPLELYKQYNFNIIKEYDDYFVVRKKFKTNT